MKICAQSRGGIGNRLNNLISAMIAADTMGYDLNIYWQTNNHLNCEFSDIFSEPQITTKLWTNAKDPDCLHLPQDCKLFINDKKINYCNMTDSEQKLIISYFKKFKIHQYIQDRVNLFINNFFKESQRIIGIHFRYDPEWLLARRNLATQGADFYSSLFLNKMYQYDQSATTFFISTSNNESRKAFLISDNVVYYDKQIDSNMCMRHMNRNKLAVIDAIIDMHILSKCDEIIVTPNSTFSECAWFFGECKPLVYNPINQRYLVSKPYNYEP
jgi:hypothetical protein